MPRKKRTKSSIRRNTLDTRYNKKNILKPKRYNLQKLQPLYKSPVYKDIVRPIINKLPKAIKKIKKNLQTINTQRIRNHNKKIIKQGIVDFNTSVKINRTNTRRKDPCKEKYENANRARRNNFFKAKGRGSTSNRPEHNREHRKC